MAQRFGLDVAVRSFRLWKLKDVKQNAQTSTIMSVAVRSFRLWKLKEGRAKTIARYSLGCSSFVPIVETERDVDGSGWHDFDMLQFVRSDCGN